MINYADDNYCNNYNYAYEDLRIDCQLKRQRDKESFGSTGQYTISILLGYYLSAASLVFERGRNSWV